MRKETKDVSCMDLEIGNIVHFYGARFEIVSTKLLPETRDDVKKDAPMYMSAIGVWIDGAEERGYFGEDKREWNFQGNKYARHAIEI